MYSYDSLGSEAKRLVWHLDTCLQLIPRFFGAAGCFFKTKPALWCAPTPNGSPLPQLGSPYLSAKDPFWILLAQVVDTVLGCFEYQYQYHQLLPLAFKLSL